MWAPLSLQVWQGVGGFGLEIRFIAYDGHEVLQRLSQRLPFLLTLSLSGSLPASSVSSPSSSLSQSQGLCGDTSKSKSSKER